MRARNGCEYVSRPAADLEHEIAGLDPLRNVLSDHVNPLSLQMSLSLTFVFSGCDLEVRVHRSLGEMKDEDVGGLDDNRTAEAPLQVRCARRIRPRRISRPALWRGDDRRGTPLRIAAARVRERHADS